MNTELWAYLTQNPLKVACWTIAGILIPIWAFAPIAKAVLT